MMGMMGFVLSKPLLASAWRIVSWLAGGASVFLGAIICFDGLTGNLTAQFRTVSLVVAAFFILVGFGFFILERGLFTIKQSSAGHLATGEMQPDLDTAWRNVLWVLTLARGGYFLFICSAIVAVLSRLQSGLHVFG